MSKHIHCYIDCDTSNNIFPGTQYLGLFFHSFQFIFILFHFWDLFANCRLPNRKWIYLTVRWCGTCACVRARLRAQQKNDINIDIKTAHRNINNNMSVHCKVYTYTSNKIPFITTGNGHCLLISRLISVGLNSEAIFLIFLCGAVPVCVRVYNFKVSLYAQLDYRLYEGTK